MIESPLLKKMRAETLQEAILVLLKDRFDTVPRSVNKPLREIIDENKLQQLILLAAKCSDMETFRQAVLS